MKKTIVFAISWGNWIIFVACIAVMFVSHDLIYLYIGGAFLALAVICGIIHAIMDKQPQSSMYGANVFTMAMHHNDEPYVAYSGIDENEYYQEMAEELEKERFVRQCGTL